MIKGTALPNQLTVADPGSHNYSISKI